MNTTNTSLHNTHLYFHNLFLSECTLALQESAPVSMNSLSMTSKVYAFEVFGVSLAYAKCIKQVDKRIWYLTKTS